MQIFLTLASIAIIAVIAWRLVVAYHGTTGPTWKRLLASSKDSATILWQYAVIAGAAFLANIEKISAGLNMPEVTSFIQGHLTPQEVAVAVFAISVITIVARLRTL